MLQRKKMQNNDVAIIYGMSGCLHCLKCEQLCQSLGIPYTHKNVMEEPTTTEFRELFPNELNVPQVIWKNTHVSGYGGFTEMFKHEMET